MGVPPRFTAVQKMPASRLGRFLAASRLRQGASLEHLAQRLPSRFTPSLLSAIESGQHPVGGGDVAVLVEAYRLDLDNLFPGRASIEIDLVNSKIVAGDHIWHLPEDPSVTEVISHYLRLVRTMRRLGPDGRLDMARLRAADITELARRFDIDGDDIEQLLAAIPAIDDVSMP